MRLLGPEERPYTIPILTALVLFFTSVTNGYAQTNMEVQAPASDKTHHSVAVSDPLLETPFGGQQTVTQKYMLVPLVNNEKVLGGIGVKIAMRYDQSNEITLLPLLNYIRPYISAALSAQLDKKSTNTTAITFSQLARSGIMLNFDANSVELRVDFAARVRREKRYGLATHATQRINESQLTPNATFSGALDYRVAKQWSASSSNNSKIELTGHLNMNGWVLQHQQNFADDRARTWLRSRTLITHDWPDNATRLSLGDLNYRQIGFMGSEQLSGISLSTNYQLQPYTINYPLSEQSFFLQQDADVEVMVNGRSSDKRFLKAGTHNIYDLPLINGVNEVELQITDVFGREQSIRFFASQDQQLLAPGKKEYSVTLGVPRLNSTSGLEYAMQSHKFSAFYRYGVNKDLTMSNWLQLGSNVSVTGITGAKKSVYGVFTGELAVSREPQLSKAYAPAIRLGYRFSSQRFTLDTQWRWQHREFANLSQSATDNNIHHQARINLTLPEINEWNTRLTVAYGRRWQDENVFSKRLNISRKLGQDWYLSINMTHYNSRTDQESFAGLQLTWRSDSSQHRASVGYSSDQRSSEYSYRSEGELGLNMRAGIRKRDTSLQQDADISYLSEHADVQLAVDRNKSASGQSSITKRASLASSVALADGQWATSRPLQGQPFAILSAQSGIADAHIGVVRGASLEPVAFLENGSDTSVLPNLSPYYVGNVYLDLSLSPVELQVKQETFKIKPAYQSATVISVGVGGKVYVTAKLTDPHGTSLKYKVVNVTEVNGTKLATTFTDASGIVVIEALPPGNYRISVSGQPILTKLITVEDKSLTNVELGTLKMSPEEK
jgi:outer membrane usher protein